jgi:hypothetical protein
MMEVMLKMRPIQVLITLSFLTLSTEASSQNADLTLSCKNSQSSEHIYLGFSENRALADIVFYSEGQIDHIRSQLNVSVEAYMNRYSWSVFFMEIGDLGLIEEELSDKPNFNFLFNDTTQVVKFPMFIDRTSLRLTHGSEGGPDNFMDCTIDENNTALLSAIKSYSQRLIDLENQYQRQLQQRRF